ncbi:ABC transporter ATP-binding protein [Nostoc sp. UHCC 0702]|nr:ABC transporter ATP-binding protein [Nostoc sp. UHCC 0702]
MIFTLLAVPTAGLIENGARYQTSSHLDRILLFDKGCIVEDDTRGELLAKRGAYYMQADGFLPVQAAYSGKV